MRCGTSGSLKMETASVMVHSRTRCTEMGWNWWEVFDGSERSWVEMGSAVLITECISVEAFTLSYQHIPTHPSLCN